MLLGELDYATDEDDAQPLQVRVAERIKHPDYLDNFKYNDIALLRLESEVSFNDYMRPACLPESSLIAPNPTATGWGRIGFNKSVSTHLQKVDLELYSHEECVQLYEGLNSESINRGILNETQTCYGVHNGHGDTCKVSVDNFRVKFLTNTAQGPVPNKMLISGCTVNHGFDYHIRKDIDSEKLTSDFAIFNLLFSRSIG